MSRGGKLTSDLLRNGDTAGAFVVPDVRNLSGLIGVAEIPVMVDNTGTFIDTLARYRLLEGETASRFETTDLSSSIATGRQFSRETRAARARLDQGAAQTGQAFSQLLPTVSVRANQGYEVSKPSVVVDPQTGELLSYSRHVRTDTSVTATQPLFDLPTFLEWRRSKVRQQSREEDVRGSDGDAYIATVETYLSLVSSRLQADVTRDFEIQLEELLHYIEKRADAGASSISDMSRVRARREATLSTRLEQESAHHAAGTDFVRLTNLVPQRVRLPQLEDIGAAALPQTFEQAVALAMESNPELAGLAAELHAERIGRAAANGRFLPRLDAEVTDTYSDNAGGSSDTQRDQRYMLVLNWNLFSGGRDLYYRSERAARYQEIQYRLDDQRRQLVQALAANYAALETVRVRLDSGYDELESIATAARAMSKRMLSGNQSLLDLLDVYDRYYQVRSRLIDLHVFEMNTVAQLMRLTVGAPGTPGTSAEDGH